MKKPNLLSLLLFATVVLISGCSSDPAAPKEQFKAHGETINLSNAKLYLTLEVDINAGHGPFVRRDYFFTDGTYLEGNGWALAHYTNATYLIAFQALVPADDGFAAGTYPGAWSFNTVESGNAAYFYVETEALPEYYEINDGDPNGTFTVSGAMNDGETMTVKFSGTLSHWHYVGEVFTETLFKGSMFAKAEVIDMRP